MLTYDTRPVFHQSDAAIRGHVFCSFMALLLSHELSRLCAARDLKPEWQPLLNDLDRLQKVTLHKDGKDITIWTPTAGMVGAVFQAAGVALPANIHENPTA
ncbi:hypothetical protein K7W03_09290 [Sphingobium sp. PNB]|uniref:ubiquitin-like domain-containing protein n=1 Tax=Sphingobium sp. PNB TaxID=863934 RepID=UPI001D01D0AA|nr:ubiquitin-like domain-containing protein [Sphingobium sp. PNB]MCB4859788.1 hypothetical protein [Sphingobium sp. PNB]